MEGNPAEFESIGSRLGFRIQSENPERVTLVWHGARFPAYLCLGIALALLLLSVPILEAIHHRGLTGPAGSLWYFPIMNFILFGISLYLFSLKRIIRLDRGERQVVLHKRSLFRAARLRLEYDEVTALRLGTDQVYSGFALAGSSAAQKYPVPSLRLVLKSGETILLDRGGMKRLESLALKLSALIEKPLEAEQRR